MSQMTQFGEYRRLILSELERLDKQIEKLRESESQMKQSIASMKVRVGLLGGGLGLGVASLFEVIRSVIG